MDKNKRAPSNDRSRTKPSSSGQLAGRRQEKEQNRLKTSGLNVVTKFATPPVLLTQPSESGVSSSRESEREGCSTHPDGFVVLSHTNDTTTSSQDSRKQDSNVEHTLSRKPKFRDGMKGPIGSVKRVNGKVTELSPSDRTLVIGISIPSIKLADDTKVSGSHIVERDDLSQLQISNSVSPLTPNNFGAPALVSPSSTTSFEQFEQPVEPARRRAASSVYSQATRYTRGVSQLKEVPSVPVPPLPSMRYMSGQASQDHEKAEPGSRITSWGTEFDEDDSPLSKNHDRWSKESQLAILKRSSANTTPTRHHSQGWWNQVLSPFLTRSNTLATKNSPTDNETVPRMPNAPTPTQIAAEDGRFDSNLKEPKVDENSPLTSAQKLRSGRSSIWTDISQWEAERRNIGHTLNHFGGHDVQDLRSPSDIEESSSPEFQEGFGFGEAAEYYEACWHDQNSPTPFFECQNHSCLPTSDAGKDTEDPSNVVVSHSKGLPKDLDYTHNTKDDSSINNQFQQKPANRFSAAFKEAMVLGVRPHGDEPTIEEEDLDVTPEVQEAHRAPVVRAKSPVPTLKPSIHESQSGSQERVIKSPQLTVSSTRQPRPYSPSQPEQPQRRYIAAPSPGQDQASAEQPLSPQPITPGVHPAMVFKGDIPMIETPRGENTQPVQHNYYVNQYYGRQNSNAPREAVTAADFPPPPKTTDEKRDLGEKAQRKPREARQQKDRRVSWKNCFGRLKAVENEDKKRKKKRRWLYCGIISALVLMVVLILVLAMTLTRKGDKMPVQTQWLNITGYPPIPTGISTIAQPNAANEDSGCVQPATLWSCALPKEQQQSITPNQPDQPNFRVEIRFRNGTAPNGTSFGKRSETSTLYPRTARSLVQGRFLRIRDALADALYTPSPAPPSQEDQSFLGNTTDNNTTPFNGEYTPFYMSFMDTTPIPSRLAKRQGPNSTNSTDPFPDLTSDIPPPDLNSDGTAAAANLLPFPSAQPLQLYNRGLSTEHYGFYTYFDRSIFLKSTALVNTTGPTAGDVPDDENGGAEEDAATVRCTWAQTRFLVQIWTNRGGSVALLPSPTPTASSKPTSTSNATLSSANDFTRPGSFPYPVSITVDRHGGDLGQKMIYCYGLDNREHVLTQEKKVQLEDRGFGGVLINPALGPFGNVNVSLSSGGPGGIDGGTGGCQCLWKNWVGAGG